MSAPASLYHHNPHAYASSLPLQCVQTICMYVLSEIYNDHAWIGLQTTQNIIFDQRRDIPIAKADPSHRMHIKARRSFSMHNTQDDHDDALVYYMCCTVPKGWRKRVKNYIKFRLWCSFVVNRRKHLRLLEWARRILFGLDCEGDLERIKPNKRVKEHNSLLSSRYRLVATFIINQNVSANNNWEMMIVRGVFKLFHFKYKNLKIE